VQRYVAGVILRVDGGAGAQQRDDAGAVRLRRSDVQSRSAIRVGLVDGQPLAEKLGEAVRVAGRRMEQALAALVPTRPARTAASRGVSPCSSR
jgi:hypothetical protein